MAKFVSVVAVIMCVVAKNFLAQKQFHYFLEKISKNNKTAFGQGNFWPDFATTHAMLAATRVMTAATRTNLAMR